MANSTESYISKISQIDPERVLRTHNLALPGLEEQMTYLHPLDEVPDPGTCSFNLVKYEDHVFGFKVKDTSLLSCILADFYDFETDFLAICGKFYVIICELNLKTLQTYCIKHLNEDLLTVSWGVYNGDLLIATAGRLGQIHVFNLQNYKSPIMLSGHLNSVNCVRFLPKSQPLLLSASEDLSIRLWNPQSKMQLSIFKSHFQGVLYLDVHHSGEIFISGSKDSSIKIWSLLQSLSNHKSFNELSKYWNGESVPILEVQKPAFSDNRTHQGYIDCVKFIHNLIVSKSQTGEIVIWKTTGVHSDIITVVKVINAPCFDEVNLKFAICKKKKLLAVGNSTGECFIYRLDWVESDNPLYILNENEGLIRNIEFSRDCIITASTTGRVQALKFEFFQSKV